MLVPVRPLISWCRPRVQDKTNLTTVTCTREPYTHASSLARKRATTVRPLAHAPGAPAAIRRKEDRRAADTGAGVADPRALCAVPDPQPSSVSWKALSNSALTALLIGRTGRMQWPRFCRRSSSRRSRPGWTASTGSLVGASGWSIYLVVAFVVWWSLVLRLAPWRRA